MVHTHIHIYISIYIGKYIYTLSLYIYILPCYVLSPLAASIVCFLRSQTWVAESIELSTADHSTKQAGSLCRNAVGPVGPVGPVGRSATLHLSTERNLTRVSWCEPQSLPPGI